MVNPCCVHRRKKNLLNRWWKALVCVAGAVVSCITVWKPFIINNKLQTINGRSGQITVTHYATLNKNCNFRLFFFKYPSIYIPLCLYCSLLCYLVSHSGSIQYNLIPFISHVQNMSPQYVSHTWWNRFLATAWAELNESDNSSQCSWSNYKCVG